MSEATVLIRARWCARKSETRQAMRHQSRALRALTFSNIRKSFERFNCTCYPNIRIRVICCGNRGARPIIRRACLRWRLGLVGGDGAIGLLARGFKSRIIGSATRSSLSGANLPAGARSRRGLEKPVSPCVSNRSQESGKDLSSIEVYLCCQVVRVVLRVHYLHFHLEFVLRLGGFRTWRHEMIDKFTAEANAAGPKLSSKRSRRSSAAQKLWFCETWPQR
jgi:hypothetical protein